MEPRDQDPTGAREPPPAGYDELQALDTRILRSSGWLAFGYGTKQVASLLTLLVLVRLLEPEAFGLVALAATFLHVVSHLQGSGIWSALVYRRDNLEEAAASAVLFM